MSDSHGSFLCNDTHCIIQNNIIVVVTVFLIKTFLHLCFKHLKGTNTYISLKAKGEEERQVSSNLKLTKNVKWTKDLKSD